MSALRRTALHVALAACLAGPARAADEMLLVVFADGMAADQISVSIDGAPALPLGRDGSRLLDLAGGTHVVQLRQGATVLHSFRVQLAAGQKLDVTATLGAGAAPRVTVDAYFESESVAEAAARPGFLGGVVQRGGAPLAGATVAVRGREERATTTADGRYRLQLPRGQHTLLISHPALGGTPLLRRVRVVAGVELARDIGADGAGAEAVAADAVAADAVAGAAPGGQVVVTARRFDQPRGLDEQYGSGIVDTIDAAEISRFGGSDVAASVVNVPSITVQDSRYLFVRGLGDRYVTTTLNGATLPSTDPSRRTVPLDLFPSNLVAQLAVRKTFTPDMPGESTGGNLLITTLSLPAQAGGKLSFSLGATPGLTGERIYADPVRGAYDAFGVDDGSRRENGLLPLIGTALTYGDEFSPAVRNELQQVGGLLLMDGWDLRRTRAAPKAGFGLSYGDVKDLGDGRRLGYYAAGNFSNGTAQRDEGVARSFGADGSVLDDFRFVEHVRNVEASGLLALGLRSGPHAFSATTLASRSTESSVRVSEGFDGDELLPSVRHSIDWIERQFLSQQVAGEHRLDGLLARWQLTASQALRDAPDRREVRFDLRGGDGVYDLSVPGLLRRFDELTDDNLDVSTDWEIPAGEGTLKLGAQAIARERDARSNSFGYQGGLGLDSNAPNRLVSDIVNAGSITGDTATGYAYLNETLPSDSYDATLRQYGVYGAYELLLGDVEILAGGRYERYDQTTETFGLQGEQTPVRARIDEGVFLPSLSVAWLIDDLQQLRLGLSRTVARPDFKETSNATFYDTEFDFRVRGNPLLRPSEVTNVDLRYERYGDGGQNASVALFYKDMKNPIERVVQPASGTAGNSRTYQNAAQARIYGIELEGRRDIALSEDLSRSLFVAVNASLIKSEVELIGGGRRELQGQPRYTANLVLGFDHVPSRQELTLLLNQNGRSIEDVGVNDLPDVIQQPRLSLNLTYRWRLAEGLEFKAKVNNLLNSPVKFTQGGQVFQSYRRGTEIEAGIDWRF